MKNIFKLTALAVFLCCLISCDDDEPIIPTLEVTPANLNGTWELSEWNGTPLAEGTYCYITFNRKEQTFEMYQKFDSMYARYITGSFSIKNDPYMGAVISGDLEYDITSIQKAGLINDGWINKFDKDSSPYTSTIVFLVRKGNPKNIKDWDDLVKDGVGVITPNPKTSGGARWNYLAAWAYANKKYNGDETQIKDFVKKLYQNVLVLDSGARGATTTFVENGQGDVLLAWENEAYLSIKDHPDDYEIVTPSISILAQPSVAVVDDVVDRRGTRDVATEYLQYLYSDEAQRIAAENYYRPSNENILKEYSDKFNLNVNLVTIKDFGGWDAVQEKHFADGGVFDEIYEKK